MSDFYTEIGGTREGWATFEVGEAFEGKVFKTRCRAMAKWRYQYKYEHIQEGDLRWWVVPGSVQWSTLEAYPRPPSRWRRVFQRKPKIPKAIARDKRGS